MLKEDNIISVLIGLVGACETNPKTASTDKLITKALAFPFIYPNPAEPIIQNTIDEIRMEKNIISPNCAQCTSPCGNTSDYDMNRIYHAEEEIRNLKLQILSKLQTMAFSIYHKQSQNPSSKFESEISFFYKALSFLSCDREKDVLLEILEEAKKQKKEIEKKIKDPAASSVASNLKRPKGRGI